MGQARLVRFLILPIFMKKNHTRLTGKMSPLRHGFKVLSILKKDERVNEFNIPMTNYNSVLTILWEELNY